MSDEGRSNARVFLSRIRDHYIDQLRAFLAKERRNSIRGESEVKLELEPGSKVFRSLTCADFVRNDGEPEILQFAPERVLSFEPVTATLGHAELRIDRLRWDDVVLEHNATFDPDRLLNSWFETWFDPDDRRYRPEADLGNVVHSLIVDAGRLKIDFGSAAPEAFWELLELLERAGATELRISGSEAETAATSI